MSDSEDYSFVVLYDISDSSKFKMNQFLNSRFSLFTTIEDALGSINDFIYKYNYLMNYMSKDLIYKLSKSYDEICKELLSEEYSIVGETENKALFICIKKIYVS